MAEGEAADPRRAGAEAPARGLYCLFHALVAARLRPAPVGDRLLLRTGLRVVRLCAAASPHAPLRDAGRGRDRRTDRPGATGDDLQSAGHPFRGVQQSGELRRHRRRGRRPSGGFPLRLRRCGPNMRSIRAARPTASPISVTVRISGSSATTIRSSSAAKCSSNARTGPSRTAPGRCGPSRWPTAGVSPGSSIRLSTPYGWWTIAFTGLPGGAARARRCASNAHQESLSLCDPRGCGRHAAGDAVETRAFPGLTSSPPARPSRFRPTAN